MANELDELPDTFQPVQSPLDELPEGYTPVQAKQTMDELPDTYRPETYGEAAKRVGTEAYDPLTKLSAAVVQGGIGMYEEAGNSLFGLKQTKQLLQGQQPEINTEPRDQPYQQPFSTEDLTSPVTSGIPKVMARIGQGAPVFVPAMGAQMIPGVGPVAGPATAAVMSAAQRLGPKYVEELQKNGGDQDAAWGKAVESAAIDGVFGGASQWAFMKPLLAGPVKDMVLQTFVVQPAVGAANQVAQNVFVDDALAPESKISPFQGAGEAAISAGAVTLGMGATHQAFNRFFKPAKVPGADQGTAEDILKNRGQQWEPPLEGEVIPPEGPGPKGPPPAPPKGQRAIEKGPLDILPEDYVDISDPNAPKYPTPPKEDVRVFDKDFGEMTDDGLRESLKRAKEFTTAEGKKNARSPYTDDRPRQKISEAEWRIQREMAKRGISPAFRDIGDWVRAQWKERKYPDERSAVPWRVGELHAADPNMSQERYQQETEAYREKAAAWHKRNPDADTVGRNPADPFPEYPGMPIGPRDNTLGRQLLDPEFEDLNTGVLKDSAANDRTAYEGGLNAQRTAKQTSLNDFFVQRFQPDDGGSVTIEQAYDAYKARATMRGETVASMPEFRERLRNYNYNISNVAGRQRVLGVKLRQNPEVQTKGNVAVFPGAKPPEQTYAVGPLQKIQHAVEENSKNVVDSSFENAKVDPSEDALGVGTIVNRELEKMQRNVEAAKRARQRQAWVNERIPYFVIDDGSDYRVMTDTDLESVIAEKGNLLLGEQIKQVNPADMKPENIMALIDDMPQTHDDPRIIQRGSMDDLQIANELGNINSPAVGAIDKNVAYLKLVRAGVRVAPSSGHSFVYGDMESLPRNPVDLGFTARSVQSQESGFNFPGAVFRVPKFANEPYGKAIDWNKIGDPRDHMISMDYDRGHAAGMPVEWTTAATAGNGQRILELAKKGIALEVTVAHSTNRVLDNAFVITSPLPKRALVKSYEGAEYGDQMPKIAKPYYKHRGKLSVRHDPNATPELRAVTDKLYKVISEVKPVFDRVLKRLGATYAPDIIISERSLGPSNAADSHWSPYAVGALNEVVFHPQFWAESTTPLGKVPGFGFEGSFEAQVTQILAHEIGHLVDFHAWGKLDSAGQEMVHAAYSRALLRYAQTRDISNAETIFNAQEKGQSLYHLSFVEWKAEQFRRFVNQDNLFRTDLENYAGEVADSWRQLTIDYMRHDTPEQTAQRFIPTQEFHKWMDYLEMFARRGLSKLQMKIIIDRFKPTEIEVPDGSSLRQTMDLVNQQFQMFKNLFAEGTRLETDTTTFSGEQVVNDFIPFGGYDAGARTVRMMIGAIAWMKGLEGKSIWAARTMLHEAWHSIEDILPDAHLKILADASDLHGIMTEKEVRFYQDYYRTQGEYVHKLEGEALSAYINKKVMQEKAAFLAESARNGKTFDSFIERIMDKFNTFMHEIYALITGRSYGTADAILHDFMRGELTRRFNRREEFRAGQRKYERSQQFNSVKARDLGHGLYGQYSSHEKQMIGLGGRTTTQHLFTFYDRQGGEAGTLSVRMKNGEPYITYIRSGGSGKDAKYNLAMMREMRRDGTSIPRKMIEYAEQELGKKFRSSQELTDDGKKMLDRVDPDYTKYYQKLEGGLWFSPKAIRDMFNESAARLEEAKAEHWSVDEIRNERETYNEYKEALAKIPTEAWVDPALAKQWAYREFELAGWERERIATANKARAEMTGEMVDPDPFEQISLEKDKAESAIGGAPHSPMSMAYRDLGKKMKLDPKDARHLTGMEHHGDQMWKQLRNWYTMHQTAWKFPHIEWLKDYIGYAETQVQRAKEWVATTGEHAKTWERLPGGEKDRNGLSSLLFWATEMRYRSAAEKAAGTVRQPTTAEIAREGVRLGLSPEALAHYNVISKDFGDFLDRTEQVLAANINRNTTNPVKRAAQLNDLAADFAKMRRKPYFPMVRFGNWTLTGKDPANNHSVEHFSAYNSRAERSAALERLKTQDPSIEYTEGQMDDNLLEFMGLPKPMLDQLKNLPGMTPAQRDWIENFGHLMSPENSFKKRWLSRQGTPGYSMDGIRAYSKYFQSGSKWLARLEMRDNIAQTIRDAQADLKNYKNSDVRAEILKKIKEHQEWMNAPAKDWITLKTLATVYHLGLAPVTAIMNLTQLHFFTFPYLTKLYGLAATKEMGLSALKSPARGMFGVSRSASPGFAEAHAEMKAQGRIDTGQAAELGNYADADNLGKTYLDNTIDRFWRGYGHYAMLMFSGTEKYNREVTFEAAYNLALKNPNAQHSFDISNYRAREIADLLTRRPTMSHEEAVAFYVAREAIDRTQFIYDSWDKPPFMRHPAVSAMSVFMSYLHSVLFALGNNPGKSMTFLFLLAAYGLRGLPGSQDADEVTKALARKIGKKDFSPHRWMREKIKELTGSDRAAEVSMNGYSRYGFFGVGMLPEGWGVPRIDISQNGSMGQLVPGLYPLAHGVANSGTSGSGWKDTTADVVKDVAGAAFSPMFAAMQIMMAPPGSGEAKKYEAAMPRGFRSIAKAYRYAATGKEVDAKGAKIAGFDWNDTDDRMTILGQALGFNPTKLGQVYDQQAEYLSRENFYKAMQQDLYVQLDQAITAKDDKGIEKVVGDIDRWNRKLISEDLASLAVPAKNVLQSMKARARARAMTEAGYPAQKKFIDLKKQNDQTYPVEDQGVIERQIVK